ncbi:hypothetical protein [Chromobacterium sp. IIBBL 290-4]|uniref:hypothetical protein n=1 Tax=Chromobacterium sp. IIBBL 290-4 TaxID=2953890 RepID=UPI0020B6EB2C|nr:hypothetical protein [Chromobacterium sp. IIBBL 290-4]UTH74122.1 hypothetical protein NKT35_21680 [Chromobacterium sp. IIBBL 290-4]
MMLDEGFPLRTPVDAFSEAERAQLGLAAEAEAPESDEEDARWSHVPFLSRAVERMGMLLLLAEDYQVEFDPCGMEDLAAAAGSADSGEDAVFAQIAAEYLAGLETLASMSGRRAENWHRAIFALYQPERL